MMNDTDKTPTPAPTQTEGEPKDCAGCQRTGMNPSHQGSRRCESGSIASGGTKAHCSCDMCF